MYAMTSGPIYIHTLGILRTIKLSPQKVQDIFGLGILNTRGQCLSPTSNCYYARSLESTLTLIVG